MIGSVRDLFSGDGWQVSDIICRRRAATTGLSRSSTAISASRWSPRAHSATAQRRAPPCWRPARSCLAIPEPASNAAMSTASATAASRFTTRRNSWRACLPRARRPAARLQQAHICRRRCGWRRCSPARKPRATVEMRPNSRRLRSALPARPPRRWPAITSRRPPTDAEERRVAEAVRRIEAAAEEPLSLGDLAEGAAAQPLSFPAWFPRVAGMTPYQFVLRTRLIRAAVRLRTTGDSVSAIAFDAGFNDLSTFNRRFRRVMGETPSAYRARRDGARIVKRRDMPRFPLPAEYPPRHSAPPGGGSRGFLALAHIWLK